MARGAVTLAVYVAIGFIPVIMGPAAVGQSSTHLKTSPGGSFYAPRPVATIAPLGTGAPIITPPPLLRAPIVISYGSGGRVDEHRQTFSGYQRAGAKVEVRGPCYSACTLLLAYVEPDNLCIASGGFMAFHAIRTEYGMLMVGATQEYYASMPLPIQRWIKDNGGWQNLPLDGYWTMYDRQLWALGYPKCR